MRGGESEVRGGVCLRAGTSLEDFWAGVEMRVSRVGAGRGVIGRSEGLEEKQVNGFTHERFGIAAQSFRAICTRRTCHILSALGGRLRQMRRGRRGSWDKHKRDASSEL